MLIYISILKWCSCNMTPCPPGINKVFLILILKTNISCCFTVGDVKVAVDFSARRKMQLLWNAVWHFRAVSSGH